MIFSSGGQWLLIVCSMVLIVERGWSQSVNRYEAYRVKPQTEQQLKLLDDLRYQSSSRSSRSIIFMQEFTVIDTNVDLVIPEELTSALQAEFRKLNMTVEVLSRDVRQHIRARDLENTNRQQSIRQQSPFRQRDDAGMPYFNAGTYHSYDEMVEYMTQLSKRYPNVAQVLTIGRTHEGRSIYAIQIGIRSPTGATKPAIWIDGGIHAREWVSPAAAVYFINRLVAGHQDGGQVERLVREIDWYIAPVINPDGYEYSRSSDNPEVRLWRKNRSPARCLNGLPPTTTQHFCCQGVDLNRNFDFHWGESGSSTDPCSEIYQGKTPFSEPETKAVRDFISPQKQRFKAFVTMHSYSQIWMYPYGHQRGAYPSDVNDLQRVAKQAVDALSSLYGTQYTVGTGADTLYPASGGAEDWAKDGAGVKFAYLLELRPTDQVWDGFFLKEREIIPTGKETFEGIKVVAEAVLNEANQAVSTNGNSVQILGCQDFDSNCRLWAQHGACSAWKLIMQQRCPMSCGMCAAATKSPCYDNWAECSQWRALGMCNTIAHQCKYSCGIC